MTKICSKCGIEKKNNKCPLLDIPFERYNRKKIDYYPTLDRIDSKKGYVDGNVVFLSHRANRIKNNLTLDEMKLLLNNWKNYLDNCCFNR